MPSVINFCKKYRLEITVISVLVLLPIIEPIFEVCVDCLFTTGNVVGTWVRNVSANGVFCR